MMSSRHRPVKVGGKRSGYGSIEKLNSYYKEPNYRGQETAVETKLSNPVKRGTGERRLPLWSPCDNLAPGYTFMTDIGQPQEKKIPLPPFNKGGFRGIWFSPVKANR
jgi:hypothetical protein